MISQLQVILHSKFNQQMHLLIRRSWMQGGSSKVSDRLKFKKNVRRRHSRLKSLKKLFFSIKNNVSFCSESFEEITLRSLYSAWSWNALKKNPLSRCSTIKRKFCWRMALPLHRSLLFQLKLKSTYLAFIATFINHKRKTKHAKIRTTIFLVHIASFQENLHWNRE